MRASDLIRVVLRAVEETHFSSCCFFFWYRFVVVSFKGGFTHPEHEERAMVGRWWPCFNLGADGPSIN